MFSDIIQQTFFQHAIIAVILSAVVSGIIGTFVFVKRLSFLSGGIAHALLGGVGFAVFVSISPMVGALIAALLFTLIMGIIKLKSPRNEESIIGALWALGMSTGIIFLHITPGYHADIGSWLFGNILMISRDELIMLAILVAIVVITVYVFYRPLVAISFDETLFKVRGLSFSLFYLLLLLIIAATVVVMVKSVGLILLIAMLTIPPAISAQFAKSIPAIMGISVIVSLVVMFLGLFFSVAWNLPAGASTILVASLAFAVTTAVKR